MLIDWGPGALPLVNRCSLSKRKALGVDEVCYTLGCTANEGAICSSVRPRYELFGAELIVKVISFAAAVASVTSKRNAIAVSSRRPVLRGRSPLINRRIARSSIPRRREAAVVPPKSWTQYAKCSFRSCIENDAAIGPLFCTLSAIIGYLANEAT